MKFEIRFIPIKGKPQQIAIVEAPDFAAAQRAAKWLINYLGSTGKTPHATNMRGNGMNTFNLHLMQNAQAWRSRGN